MSKTYAIYEIEHLPTGSRYVGASSRICARISSHFSCLRNKTHGNHFLQKLWDSSKGEDDFSYKIIEVSDEETAFDREAFWVKHYSDQNLSLNCTKTGWGGRPATGRTSKPMRVPKALVGAIRKLINDFNGGKK